MPAACRPALIAESDSRTTLMLSADDDAPDPQDNLPPGYVPPKVWKWDTENGGAWAKLNRPLRNSARLTVNGSPESVPVAA